ncbi:MAG: flagellar export chaperone FliS [Limisphaerales bacterium]
MYTADPLKSYKKIATLTTPPGHLVLMLYDAALRSLECALIGFDAKDPGERNTTIHNNLQRTMNIVRELNFSLNREAGGDLADTLCNLYAYFEERLQESNLKKQRTGVDEVIRHITGLREAWAGMLVNQGLPQPLVIASEAWAAPLLRAA